MDDLKLCKFYSTLREAQHFSGAQEIPTNIQLQHDFLNPKLRPYQENAVKWMMQRELTPDFFTPDYFKVSSANDADEYYIDPSYPNLTSSKKPKNVEIPSGGILADEMGLGKTVEMLALILANKRKKRKFDEIIEIDDVDSDVDEKPLSRFLHNKGALLCICDSLESKSLIVCSKCLRSQHKKCVAKYRLDKKKTYMCPRCWSAGNSLIHSSATIIVSPVAIKSQWESEISKHINDDRFKVFIYNGVSQTGWISPSDLAEYDVVLTDYNILRSEIHYLNENTYKGALRHEKKYMHIVSPLTFIHWWRVCLDEAQMVEHTMTNASKMVKTLPAVHRWSITGTPMEKSFDDLYGLVFFMDCEPFTVNSFWRSLTSPIHLRGDFNPLINVLKKIMWRTCKSGVLDQLNIPPQTEQITYITMSDAERLFYESECAEYSEAFRKKMIYEYETSLLLSGMTGQTKTLILEGFRKLRQDCTVPTKLKTDTDTTLTRNNILDPVQFLNHLISTNVHECSLHLRSLILSLNGIAAVHIMNKEYREGINVYKSVLRWVKDYSETNLRDKAWLQVHAIHNLLEVFSMQGDEREIEHYEQVLSKLESHFMKPYSNSVSKAKDELQNVLNTINKVSAKMRKDHNWFRDIIYETQKLEEEDSEKYFDKFKRYVERVYGNQVFEKELTVHIVDSLITTWIDKIEVERYNMKNKFEKLKYFTDNIKSKHELIRSDADKIQWLVHSAFLCHLNPKTMYDPNKELCELCQIKASMKVYETIIFSKTLNLDTDLENVGTWQATFFEWMLKYIKRNYKHSDDHDDKLLEEGEIHLKYLSLLAVEYKAYSSLYVELNYVATAFDELKMCKTRLDVKPVLTNFQNDLNVSENSFFRVLGRLKYLKHLSTIPKEVNCSSCKLSAEKRYSFLLCGHILCLTCLLKFAKMENLKSISCCVCGKKTHYKDIFYINNKNEDEDPRDELPLNGKYSSKIEAIVKKVLELKQEDKNVKIIIFSHWDSILQYIGTVLQENDIKLTFKHANYIKSISDFKNMDLGITCLLLPLHFGSKGLNLIEASHVFLIEPIMTPSMEFQAVGRIHRIGQTKPTVVHRFIVKNTIEENIYNTIINDKSGLWKLNQITIVDLNQLFKITDQGILSD